MPSRIISGNRLTLKEPIRQYEYEVLSSPSSISLDIIPGTFSETSVGGIRELSAHVKVSELRNIRMPMDANPRKPEQLPVVVEIQNSAGGADSNIFVYKNNGMDVFCQSVIPARSGQGLDSPVTSLAISFGTPDDRDGVCNGAITYFALTRLPADPDAASVKIRFYIFQGAPRELKVAIAKAKNKNRAVSSSDDANFMGYFQRMKDQLGTWRNLVKWQTGDVELSQEVERPVPVQDYVRFLSCFTIGDAYHWDQSRDAPMIDSHRQREIMMRNPGTAMSDFISNMRVNE